MPISKQSQKLKEQWILAKGGNQESLDFVFYECQKFFQGLCCRYKIPYNDNYEYDDDIIQECLMYLHQRFNDYNPKFSPTTFLHFIWMAGKSRFVNPMVKVNRYKTGEYFDLAESVNIIQSIRGHIPDYHSDFLLKDMLKELLSNKHYNIIDLFFYKNWTIKEISKKYKCTVDNIRKIRETALNKILDEKIIV